MAQRHSPLLPLFKPHRTTKHNVILNGKSLLTHQRLITAIFGDSDSMKGAPPLNAATALLRHFRDKLDRVLDEQKIAVLSKYLGEECKDGDTADTRINIMIRVASAIRSQKQKHVSIDDVIQEVLQEKMDSLRLLREDFDHFRQAVFGIIGLVTMLFTPSQEPPKSTLQISVPDNIRIPICEVPCSKSSLKLSALFRNFGELFPTPSRSDLDDTSLHDSAKPSLYSSQLCYYSLHKISNIRIVWVDTLNAHMQFDPLTRKLMVFRFPSFCAWNLINDSPASAYDRILIEYDHDSDTTSQPTRSLLREILLSYRVVFARDKRSRRLFRSKNFRSDMEGSIYDPWLDELCGRKKIDQSNPWSSTLQLRNVYNTTNDFSILGERLKTLQTFNMQQDPRTLRGFWSDRRNPFNFFTFWAVIIVGSISILLAIVQCFIGIAQLAVALRQCPR